MSTPDIESPSAADESTPLVESPPEDEVVNTPGQLKPMKENNVKEYAVAGVSGTGFVTALVSIMFYGSPIVWITGAFGVVLAPFATFQQQKLTQCEALAETNAFFKAEVERLAANNEKLSGTVNELEGTVDKIEEKQNTFEKLNSMQGNALDDLERQVAQQRNILKNSKNLLLNEIVGNITDIMMKIDGGDDGGDGILDDDEIEKLIEELETIGNLEIHNEKLRAVIIENGRSPTAMMGVLSNLIGSEGPEEDRIFRFLTI